MPFPKYPDLLIVVVFLLTEQMPVQMPMLPRMIAVGVFVLIVLTMFTTTYFIIARIRCVFVRCVRVYSVSCWKTNSSYDHAGHDMRLLIYQQLSCIQLTFSSLCPTDTILRSFYIQSIQTVKRSCDSWVIKAQTALQRVSVNLEKMSSWN